MAFTISLPWLKGPVDGLTRRNELRHRPALQPGANANETRLDAGRTLTPYPEPPRLSYFEQNFDRVGNSLLQAVQPDIEVEGIFLDPTIGSMLKEDLSDYRTTHQIRRMEVLEYQAAIEARLAELELEMREITNAVSDRTLIEQRHGADTGRVLREVG